MSSTKRDQIRNLLKGIETGDPESNRSLVRSFASDVLLNRQLDTLTQYISDADGYTEHNPHRTDGLPALRSALSALSPTGEPALAYTSFHRVLAEGSFVLCAAEGYHNGTHSALYDLFRIAGHRIVEHWDSVEAIPPRSDWQNDNGKF